MHTLKNRFLTLAFALILSMGYLNAQIVINEISYNPPESGNDSLEYIELYNAGVTAVNLEGWYFIDGVEDTLPNVELMPGDYFVTAINAQAMMNVFGISVHEWLSGALSNGGELITLADADGNVMDVVEYDDGDPWPTEPDGDGPSLELIDASMDNNDGANWQTCGAATGVIINGNEVFGTPGAENSSGGTGTPDVTVAVGNFQFNPKNIVVETGAFVRWVNNEATAHNVNGSQASFPGNPDSFGNGAPAGNWTYDYTTTLPGLYNYQCDPHAGAGMNGTMSVYDPNNYTDFPLSHLRLTDGINGAHIFDGVPTRVTGVVHGVNFRPDGYSFFVIDGSNVGINVFSFDPLSYVVQEGDMLTVSGTIDAFNGMLEIVPDEIDVLSTGNSLVMPRVVSSVTEVDESSYLQSDLMVDSVGNISSSGYTIYTKHQGGSSVEVRVDADSSIPLAAGDIAVGASISVLGAGTQFDNNFPWKEGYQILAFDLSVAQSVELIDVTKISMQPNPTSDFITLTSELEISQVEIYSMNGRQLFTAPYQHHQMEIQVNTLPVGIHLVKAITEEGVWTSMLSVVR